MTLEEIRAYIEADRAERERVRRLYDYYRGHNAILDEPKKGDDKPDNRLAHNYQAYICNTYTGYMFGEPVSYAPYMSNSAGESGENEDLFEALQETNRYNDEEAENAALGLDCSICGKAVELMYVDPEAHLRFARVDPGGCIARTDGTLEDAMTALIRYYDRYDILTRETVRTVEVYDAETITVYKSSGGVDSLAMVEQRPHFFGDVPAIVYKNNLFGLGDAEGVLTLVDAYDRMQSDGVNDQQYFSDAYLALLGIGDVDDEKAKSMKRDRLLLLPEGSDAKWLVKQQSDATPQNIKESLRSDIHKLSGCPDMSDEKFAGNISGVALKYKLLAFEHIARIKEREFKRGLQRRIELMCRFWAFQGRGSWDWRGVSIKFHRALPENLLELSQVVSNLSDVVSDETKRSLLPMPVDEETEKARLQEQYGESLFTAKERRTGELEDDGGAVK